MCIEEINTYDVYSRKEACEAGVTLEELVK